MDFWWEIVAWDIEKLPTVFLWLPYIPLSKLVCDYSCNICSVMMDKINDMSGIRRTKHLTSQQNTLQKSEVSDCFHICIKNLVRGKENFATGVQVFSVKGVFFITFLPTTCLNCWHVFPWKKSTNQTDLPKPQLWSLT